MSLKEKMLKKMIPTIMPSFPIDQMKMKDIEKFLTAFFPHDECRVWKTKDKKNQLWFCIAFKIEDEEKGKK